MSVNPTAVSFIKRFESCRLAAYEDSRGVSTIGWGHTGPEVKLGLVWSQAQADAQLELDVEGAAAACARNIARLGLSEQQEAALISFEFNTGGLPHSQLAHFVNAGNWMAVAHAFLPWDHIGKAELKGLLIRRLEEAALFLSGSR